MSHPENVPDPVQQQAQRVHREIAELVGEANIDGIRQGLAVAAAQVDAAIREAQIIGEARSILEILARRFREIAARVHNERLTDIELLLKDLPTEEEPPDAERP